VNLAGNASCVLRLAVPLAQVDEAIAQVRWRILEASSVAALLALGIAYFTSRSLSRRIRRVEQFAGGLVKARFAETLPPEPDDELGALARSLNGMSAQLRGMLERLKLEAARREAILDGIVEGVLAVDHELCVAFCNQAFVRAVGARYPVPERLPVLELVRDPAFLNLLTSTVVKAEQRKLRLQLPAAEGRTFEVQAAPLELRSGRGAIIILHDVTDLERLERVRRDFVANVSHELRTPLAAIQGYAETLLAGGLEDQERKREFVGIIQAHAIRLTNICTDLLALSELESGGAGPQPQQVSVTDVLEFAIAAVQREASLREVKIHRPESGSAVVAASGTGLEQVLVNLLGNAVKFNRPGGEVRVDIAALDDGRVRIAVADNGIGIPSADLPRIFERFYRVDRARSRDTGGTGLGLAIVKHTVERMGGAVAVESQLGQGSQFVVTLPGAEIKGTHEAD
jgi:two-component system phosphate regulon sensor histidine kinase PhoR